MFVSFATIQIIGWRKKTALLAIDLKPQFENSVHPIILLTKTGPVTSKTRRELVQIKQRGSHADSFRCVALEKQLTMAKRMDPIPQCNSLEPVRFAPTGAHYIAQFKFSSRSADALFTFSLRRVIAGMFEKNQKLQPAMPCIHTRSKKRIMQDCPASSQANMALDAAQAKAD